MICWRGTSTELGEDQDDQQQPQHNLRRRRRNFHSRRCSLGSLSQPAGLTPDLKRRALRPRTLAMATAELESIAQDHTHDPAIFLIADHEGGGCVVVFEAVDELSGYRAAGLQLVDQLGLVPCHRNRSMQPFKL
ncbi:hypothetical protein M0R45_036856 [Rubus argutus]|uniref:Uncharacterized protein n=1 Tax=Rubus argutus TaxID=59490 RepID=A0AAW1VXA7_RUBAR